MSRQIVIEQVTPAQLRELADRMGSLDVVSVGTGESRFSDLLYAAQSRVAYGEDGEPWDEERYPHFREGF